MTTFTPVTKAEQVPGLGQGAEHALWDLKERLSPVDFEHAKDVAAFANHLGGTILIGVVERDSRIEAFRPLLSQDADAYEQTIAHSLENRCRPVPLINFERIHHPEGLLLAVNVWPSVAAVIGVSVRAGGNGYGGTAWVFPVRLGNDTTYISSESLPMHMLPQLRRTLILLASIKNDEEVLYCPKGGNNSHCKILEVNELTNSIAIQRSPDESPFTIALDRIVTVFRASVGPPYWRIVMHTD